MKRLLTTLLALFVPAGAAGYTADVGNVAVIEDFQGTTFCDPTGGGGCFAAPDMLCREAAKIFFETHCDDFDGIVAFRQFQITDPFLAAILNVQQGTPVKQYEQGIGRPAYDSTASYGSAGRLEQCASMAGLYSIPDDPDGPATALFGLPLGLTGLELLGHEYGHHWLLSVEYDRNDGLGPRHILRGYEDGPNQHYSASVDSRSVMYGNFITDLGGGNFESCGGDRKFNELDQYLMGLRPASQVSSILLVDDGSGEGDPSVSTPNGQCGTRTGTRVDVTIDDIIRAEGPRIPDSTQEKHDLRIAFVLVTPLGVDATAVEIAKVDAYRTAFESWWPWATDNLGTIDTTLTPPTCGTGGTDGGTPDAGSDGGVVIQDGGDGIDGGARPDGSTNDGGVPPGDGGTPPADGGTPPGDAGGSDGGANLCDIIDCDGGTGGDSDAGIGTLPVGGCSCNSAGPTSLLGAFLVLVFAIRRRR